MHPRPVRERIHVAAKRSTTQGSDDSDEPAWRFFFFLWRSPRALRRENKRDSSRRFPFKRAVGFLIAGQPQFAAVLRILQRSRAVWRLLSRDGWFTLTWVAVVGVVIAVCSIAHSAWEDAHALLEWVASHRVQGSRACQGLTSNYCWTSHLEFEKEADQAFEKHTQAKH
jgi:hypothetical protein